MSYVIEYDRQFVRSEEGITPLWLAGDSNVWEPTYKTKKSMRRCRSWSVFYNLLGTTEEALLDAIQPSLGRWNQHWKKNGKWVDDAALLRWIHNGCQKAASIEEILRVNNMSAVRCYISDYGNPDQLSQSISTTAEFDEWIRSVKAYLLTHKGYPIVWFDNEPINHPSVKDRANEQVVIKKKNMYLSEISSNGYSFSIDVSKALVMSWEMATDFLRKHRVDARILSASVKEVGFHLLVTDGFYANTYIQKLVKHYTYFTRDKQTALRYATKQSAEAAKRKLEQRGYSVEIIEA